MSDALPETGFLDGAAIHARVREFAPSLRDRSGEIEAGRRLPEDVVASLRATGVFRMPMPRAWGGPEVDPLTQVRILEELAVHDAAAAWVAMICCDGGYYAAFLSDEVAAKDLYDDLDLLTSGWLSPAGRAEEVDGGYEVSGRWQFGSGVLHADRIVGGCIVHRDGEMQFDDSGTPLIRAMFLPKDQVHVHDTWHTTGLCGTGSNDYSAEKVFVAAERTFSPLHPGHRSEPLYQYHGLFFTKLVGVALGCGRRAVEEFHEVATTKLSVPSLRPISGEYRVQLALAESQADLDAARALTESVFDDIWATLTAGDTLTTEQRARVGALGVWVTQTVRRLVERLCTETGTSAVFRDSPLERLRRDMITMTSHLAGQQKTYQVVGQMEFGQTPAFSIF